MFNSSIKFSLLGLVLGVVLLGPAWAQDEEEGADSEDAASALG